MQPAIFCCGLGLSANGRPSQRSADSKGNNHKQGTLEFIPGCSTAVGIPAIMSGTVLPFPLSSKMTGQNRAAVGFRANLRLCAEVIAAKWGSVPDWDLQVPGRIHIRI